MTKEEAINQLEINKKDDTYVIDDEVLDMSISALSENKGEWIVHPKGIYAHLVCNKCLASAPYDCKTNFCPNCGADMRGGNETDN